MASRRLTLGLQKPFLSGSKLTCPRTTKATSIYESLNNVLALTPLTTTIIINLLIPPKRAFQVLSTIIKVTY